MGEAGQAKIDAMGGLKSPNQSTGLIGSLGLGGNDAQAMSSASTAVPDVTGKGASTFARGGRTGFASGGIPGLDDLKKGQSDLPDSEAEATPMSSVIKQGTQAPSELANEMKGMSSGAGSMGGGSSGGLGSTIGTLSSLASLGSMAMSAGSWIGTNILPFLFLSSGGRVGKAGGGAMVNTHDPKYQQMKIAFDNMVKKYDHNPLLAAAALDAGPSVVDAALRKAQQTGNDVTDFLPRRTQEYMYALSQAALGAHRALSKKATPAPGLVARAAGGRTGYALGSSVDDTSTGLAPAPSDAMTMGDAAANLPAPEPTTDVAELELKNPQFLKALAANENPVGNPKLKNPNSTAGGLFQYTDPTWRKEAPLSGVDVRQFPTAISANAEMQQKVADDNVSRILAANNGNILAVPHMWYAGNPQGNLTQKQLDANKSRRFPNGMTQADYDKMFLSKFGGDQNAAPTQVASADQASAAAPVQVASATGLAPKSDAGPFERTFGKILPDAVPTDSSFWVPLIAGLGSMLASNQYRFSQRLGEGLIGGAAAYGKQQEFGLQQQQLQQKNVMNSIEMAKYLGSSFTRFIDPLTQKVMWKGPNGPISDEDHAALMAQASSALSGPSASSNVSKVLQGIAPSTSSVKPDAGLASQPFQGAPAPKPIVGAALPPPNAQATQAQPQPATGTSVTSATASAFDESKIASANDRPMALKQQVENLTQTIDKAQHEGVTGADLASLVTQRQQLQDRADAIINGTIIPYDKEGKSITYYKDAANQRTQDASLTDAVGKNKAQYYNNATDFLSSYPQNKQLINSMATVYRSLNMNRATGNMADAVGYLRSIPGLSAVVPESLATMQGGYDEAMKNGVLQAFGQMAAAQGEKAPKAIMSEALQTVATPTKAPEARMALLAQKSAQLDRQSDMYSDWISSNKPDPAQFAIDWNKDPAHDPEKYIQKAQKEIGVFKGAAPLAGNPPISEQGQPSVSQIGQPSQVRAEYLRNYVMQNPAAKEKAIAEFDRHYYPGAANQILGVK
jgi:hypothetical protein